MTPAPKRNKLLQSLYLEPNQSKLLDELAEETRVPKAVLLREAVDDLLSKHRKGAITPTYVRIRAALKAARTQLMAYRRILVDRKLGLYPLRNCDHALGRIDQVRADIGD